MTTITTINCPYIGNCVSCPTKCDSCQNNTAIKEDHYQLRNPWQPYPWWQPTYIWYGNTNTLTSTYTSDAVQTGNHFKEIQT